MTDEHNGIDDIDKFSFDYVKPTKTVSPVKRISAPWDPTNVYVDIHQTQTGDVINRSLGIINPPHWFIHPRVKELLGLGYVKQRTAEWKQSRQLKITASKVANVIREEGKTKEHAFFEEVGVKPRFSGNKYTKHGIVYEPHAIDYYMYNTKHLGFQFGLILHPQYSFLGGSPDLIRDDGVLVEIKCPYHRKPQRIANLQRNIIPQQYMCQIQLLLEITDLEVAHYVEYYPPLFGTKIEMYIVHVNRDRNWFSTNLPKMQEFHERLVNFVAHKADLVRQRTLWKFKYRHSNSWKHLLVAYLYHVRYLQHIKRTRQHIKQFPRVSRHVNIDIRRAASSKTRYEHQGNFGSSSFFSDGEPPDTVSWKAPGFESAPLNSIKNGSLLIN